ncbi:MAG: ROK family protein [Cellulosilyticaceae bacterium]
MTIAKKTNRTRILEFIFRNAPVSRATIAENTDITPATVTTTTAALIEENVILDLGEIEESSEITPGRKRMLLNLNPNYHYGLGIELTEKHITFCITNLRGCIIDQIIFSTTSVNIANITKLILETTTSLINRHLDIAEEIVGIGIAVPGKLDCTTMRLVTDTAIGKALNIGTLKEHLTLPIVFENNIRAMAYGQYLFDPTNVPTDFALFQVGMGMYCANIVSGELIKENPYISGEIGHTIVQIDGRRCECGKYGCLQNYASEKWLLYAAKLLYASDASPILKSLAPSIDCLTFENILTAYALGEPIIGNYISQALKYLSMTISNILIISNPTKIYLHGHLFSNATIDQQLLDLINRDLTFMHQNYAQNIAILPYNPMRGALGASALAINTYFINL